ncbi:MAG: TolC family protein [Candidatus Aminicenantes bacterium]|nr:MAG: TolC family protein [Candidatus Aminicenantes bacterium]
MKKALIVTIFWVIICGLVFSAQSPEGKELTLKDAIYHALKNNLGLQVQKAQTRVARLNLRINRAQLYLPALTVNSGYSKSKQPSTDLLQGVESVEEETLYWNVGIDQQTPLGGTFNLTFASSRGDTNVITETYNPTLNTALSVSLEQPLLRNFGTLATNYQIYVAANNHKMSKHQLEQAIVNLVYEVEAAYWELVYSHQNLEAAKMALKRAKDLLHQNEVKVKVGTAAPIEILSSKANVARNESAVIQAEQAIQSREEALKRILNMSKEPFAIIPKDEPEIKDVPVDFDAFLTEAMENRADMNQAKITLENNGLTVKYRRNQGLPNLQMDTTFESSAVGGTTWDFPIPNPFDPDFVRIKTEEISFADTIKDIFKLENTYFSVGFNLNSPILLTAERAQLAQAKIERERAMFELKDLENTIYSEVKDVIKQLESNKQLVEADKIALELEGENLKAEEKKLSVGLSTNFQVLQYQQQYAAAQTQLLRSTINYVLTSARIDQVLNRTLKKYDIEFKNILEE